MWLVASGHIDGLTEAAILIIGMRAGTERERERESYRLGRVPAYVTLHTFVYLLYRYTAVRA